MEISIDDDRKEAITHVEQVWQKVLLGVSATTKDMDFENVLGAEHSLELLDAIWYASTNILPHLEVQAVIDSKNNIFVSTGTAGYVDYLTIDPSNLVGMKLPIKCWIHTHPFGAAYFSGTDWRTISTWKSVMKSAYVLGSEVSSAGHYGFWNQSEPNMLEVYYNGEHAKTQELLEEEE